MPTDNFTHLVFVDFENVPTVDLGLVAGKSVHVTLLIGKKQTWLDLSLVQQMRRIHDQVDLVEVGASGRNALDLTLACYLGQAVQRSPGAEYFIVSKDKDFEAMIGHLQHKGTKVTRHDSFASLPFLAQAKAITPPKKAAASKAAVPAKAILPEDRLEKLIKRLKENSAPRPKKKASLLARISTDFGNKLNEAELNQKLDELVRRGVLVIEDKDKVRYL